MSGDRRIERLARRVAWLDRHRRLVAIVLAVVVAPISISSIADWLPDEWPGVHLIALGTLLAVLTWYVIEVGLAWVTAVWETECARLSRVTLPTARLLPRDRP
jgi:hypothetical protein